MANEAPDLSQSEMDEFLKRVEREENNPGYAELLRRLNERSLEIFERGKTAD
jgi:hypothetical protein